MTTFTEAARAVIDREALDTAQSPTVDDLPAILADIKARAVAAGKIPAHEVIVSLHFYAGGAVHFSGGIGAGSTRIYATSFAEARAAAEAWIAHDDVAEGNLTLGLTPDGRLPPPLAEAAE